MYSYKQVDSLINRYFDLENNEVVKIREGVLGSGDWLCTAEGKKTAVIKEIFVNSWYSTHTVRMYNKTPKKYLKFLSQ